MTTVTKMRLGFEAAVENSKPSPLKARIVRSLQRRIGVKFARKAR